MHITLIYDGPKPEIAAKGIFVSLEINPTNIMGLIVTACSRSGLALDTSLYNLKNSIKNRPRTLGRSRQRTLCNFNLLGLHFFYL